MRKMLIHLKLKINNWKLQMNKMPIYLGPYLFCMYLTTNPLHFFLNFLLFWSYNEVVLESYKLFQLGVGGYPLRSTGCFFGRPLPCAAAFAALLILRSLLFFPRGNNSFDC